MCSSKVFLTETRSVAPLGLGVEVAALVWPRLARTQPVAARTVAVKMPHDEEQLDSVFCVSVAHIHIGTDIHIHHEN